MKLGWKRAALALAAGVLSLALTGCSMSGFADYDVSGYFQALLDSSYRGDNTEYMTVAATTEENAQQNNVTTVQNAAVNFCNTYGISPSDEQLSQLEDVMRQALTQANYTVKDEQKVETGYYLEVEIDPIVNFSDLQSQIDALREEAGDEATAANSTVPQDDEEDSTYSDDGYDDGYDDSYDGSEDSYGYDDTTYEEDDDGAEESSQTETSEDTQPVDANTLFVDKVVELCQGELSNIRYGSEMITITLDIRQTSEGELQLDTNQLDTIDRTVLQFQS